MFRVKILLSDISKAVNCNGDGPGGTVVKIFQAVMAYWVTMV